MYDYGYDYGNDYIVPDILTPGIEETVDTAGSILGAAAVIGVVLLLVSLVVAILLVISNYKIFEKAKRNGWESLVPIHNIFVLLEIAGTPTWHIFLFFVPIANIYALFRMTIDLAHKFGKSTGFGVAAVFFSFVCFPILAFSKKVQYNSGSDIKQETTTNIRPENIPATLNDDVVPVIPTYSEPVMPVQNEVPVQTTAPEQVIMNTENMAPPVQGPAVNMEMPVYSQTTNTMNNTMTMPTAEPTPMQPTYYEPALPTPMHTEPIIPVQNEVPVQNVPQAPVNMNAQNMVPPVQGPVVNNTVVMPGQNNNNPNGTMM